MDIPKENERTLPFKEYARGGMEKYESQLEKVGNHFMNLP